MSVCVCVDTDLWSGWSVPAGLHQWCPGSGPWSGAGSRTWPGSDWPSLCKSAEREQTLSVCVSNTVFSDLVLVHWPLHYTKHQTLQYSQCQLILIWSVHQFWQIHFKSYLMGIKINTSTNGREKTKLDRDCASVSAESCDLTVFADLRLFSSLEDQKINRRTLEALH